MSMHGQCFRRISLIAILLSGGLTVTACNTVEGAGEDIQGAGHAIEDTAQDTKKKLKE